MPHKIAIIGLGKIAIDQHVPSILANEDFELAAIVSGRRATVHDLPSFRTQEELYEAMPDVKLVAICTPPAGRFETTRTALRAGRDVLIEKPPAATLGEIAELAAIATAERRVLFTTWHSRFNPAVEEARRRLAGRRLQRLEVDWREDVRRWHPGQAWIWEAGGFGVFDPGINALSIVTEIMPEAIFVAAAKLEVPANRQTPIGAEITFQTPATSRACPLTIRPSRRYPLALFIQNRAEAEQPFQPARRDQCVVEPAMHRRPRLAVAQPVVWRGVGYGLQLRQARSSAFCHSGPPSLMDRRRQGFPTRPVSASRPSNRPRRGG